MEHDHEGEAFHEVVLEIVLDPPHIVAEVTFEVLSYVIVGLLLVPLVKRWVRRHDAEHHPHDYNNKGDK